MDKQRIRIKSRLEMGVSCLDYSTLFWFFFGMGYSRGVGMSNNCSICVKEYGERERQRSLGNSERCLPSELNPMRIQEISGSICIP